MSLEEICYKYPYSCYSCTNGIENGNTIQCKLKGCNFKVMFEDGSNCEHDMEVEYRQAAICAMNCGEYDCIFEKFINNFEDVINSII